MSSTCGSCRNRRDRDDWDPAPSSARDDVDADEALARLVAGGAGHTCDRRWFIWRAGEARERRRGVTALAGRGAERDVRARRRHRCHAGERVPLAWQLAQPLDDPAWFIVRRSQARVAWHVSQARLVGTCDRGLGRGARAVVAGRAGSRVTPAWSNVRRDPAERAVAGVARGGGRRDGRRAFRSPSCRCDRSRTFPARRPRDRIARRRRSRCCGTPSTAGGRRMRRRDRDAADAGAGRVAAGAGLRRVLEFAADVAALAARSFVRAGQRESRHQCCATSFAR